MVCLVARAEAAFTLQLPRTPVPLPVAAPTLVLLYNHSAALRPCLSHFQSPSPLIALDIGPAFDLTGWAVSDLLWPVLPQSSLTVVACLNVSAGDTNDLSFGWYLMDDLSGKVEVIQAIASLEGSATNDQVTAVKKRLLDLNSSWILEADENRLWSNRLCSWTQEPISPDQQTNLSLIHI